MGITFRFWSTISHDYKMFVAEAVLSEDPILMIWLCMCHTFVYCKTRYQWQQCMIVHEDGQLCNVDNQLAVYFLLQPFLL